MDFLNKLGIISLALTLISLYFVGEKIAIGWLIFIISYIIQIYVFYKTKQLFLIIQMAILSLFSVYNYFKWIGVI
jgi:hypothetical protein